MTVKSNEITNTLPIGTKLIGEQQTYHIEEVLGQGGYGITYKVWAIIKNGQIPVKVPFAIKEHFVKGRCHRADDSITVEYTQEAAEDVEESLRDFIKEGRLLNRICQTQDEASRFIVPVNEVIEVHNTAYYVMQYLEGGNLRDLVLSHDGGLPEPMALALIKPIARAVDFIHKHQILHMDIKPSNIVMHKNLLTGRDEPVLIDFGVSLHFNKKGGLTSKHTSIGRTEGFSPIEQYGAVESFAPCLDVYALGATLCYLLTGTIPPSAFHFNPGDIDTILPASVSLRTRTAIKHAMAKDYHDRTQSASTFLWELENDFEPVGMKAPYKQTTFEDTNVTVKKKVTPKSNNPAIRVFLHRLSSVLSENVKRIGMGLLLLMAAYGMYLLFHSEDFSKDYVIMKRRDFIEREHKDSKEDVSSDSIEKILPIVEELESPIQSGSKEEAETKRKEEVTHQQDYPTKPQKAEAKPENKAKPEPEQKVLSDAEVYAKAKANNDWATIEALGNKGYSSAYYELARHYWLEGNPSGKKWAEKAIKAGVRVEDAIKLLVEFE